MSFGRVWSLRRPIPRNVQAPLQLADRQLRTVYFDDALVNVVAARIRGGPFSRARLLRDELHTLVDPRILMTMP